MKRLILLAAASWLAATGMAQAWCSQAPRAPKAPSSYDKPQEPACLRNARFGENECEPYELNRYRQEVDDYLRALQDYANEAQTYAREAQDYARCAANEVSG